MSDQVKEVVTDPRYIYKDDLNVLAYRMGLVETALGDIKLSIDNIANNYPTNTVLDLILKPLRDDVKELKAKDAASEAEKAKNTNQLKTAIILAIVGPVATFIMTMIMVRTFGGNNYGG